MPRPQRARRRRVETTHSVVMLAYPSAQVLDITGPLEVFSRTSRWLREHRGLQRDAYRVELVAARAGRLETSGGLELYAARRYGDVETMDTLLIAGGIGYRAAMADKQLVRWIHEQAGRVERIGSICTGAFLLAAADVLNNKPATTHWAYCDELARIAPAARIERDAIYVQSGNLYTSAGVTSGMDMALAMVEADWGKATALAVAQELVMFLKRPRGQSQFSRYVRRLRVEQARSRIEGGVMRMKQVARECGFADEQNLRRAFLQVLGVTPADYRSRFG
jgi:transcriptional regulator GlxA family with amidase domain